jgi:hypothetical protein
MRSRDETKFMAIAVAVLSPQYDEVAAYVFFSLKKKQLLNIIHKVERAY